MSEIRSDNQTPQVGPSYAVGTAAAVAAGRIDPTALTVEQMAHLLTTAGDKHADAETIRRHVAAGAPVSAEGKINLVHYIAWLVREVSRGEE